MVKKALEWLGNSRNSIRSFPPPVRDAIGYALFLAQMGEKHANAKPMHGLGPGVMEIVASDPSGTYRAVYTVSIGKAFTSMANAGQYFVTESSMARRTAASLIFRPVT